MTRVALMGCTPQPLAGYLRGLAVLRLVAEQEDPAAAGWWEGGTFQLESTLDGDGLVRFFLEWYRPTPFVMPWGARSGFYPGASETAAREALVALERTSASRLAPLREGIAAARSLLRELGLHGKTETPQAKLALLRAARAHLPEAVVEWLDAAVVLSADGRAFPPLFGTGGNEGSQGYGSTFCQMLVALGFTGSTLASSAEVQVRALLLGGPATDLVGAPSGQHDPGRSGGFNQGHGIENKLPPTNPWAFVLTMEGAAAWASGAPRQLGAGGNRAVASPFTVRPRAVGYGSTTGADESSASYEVWAPLWEAPCRWPELRSFLAEGRADLGRKPATNALQFAEAAASLGVDRGVRSFMRYSLLRRRGKSYVAVPVGEFPVQTRTESDLVAQLDSCLGRLDQFLRAFTEPPTRFASARRVIDERIYETLLRGGAPQVKELVAAVGRMEQLLATRGGAGKPALKRPLTGLSPAWLVAANDGSLEVRIAAAMASIRSTGEVGPLRANLTPVDPSKPWLWAAGHGQVAWQGGSQAARMAAVLGRRLVDRERTGTEATPLHAAILLPAEDAAAFIDGAVDEDLLEALLFGFTWIDWSQKERLVEACASLREAWAEPAAPRPVPRSYAVLKLLLPPEGLAAGQSTAAALVPEPAVLPLLTAGRVEEACRLSQRRLRSAGLRPLQVRMCDAVDGVRLAAALLIPTRSRRLVRMVCEDAARQ